MVLIKAISHKEIFAIDAITYPLGYGRKHKLASFRLCGDQALDNMLISIHLKQTQLLLQLTLCKNLLKGDPRVV